MDRARATGDAARSGRVVASVVSLALLGATLAPLLRDPHEDSFPLSTYPMFATKRPTQQTFRYALGVTNHGERRTLDPHLIGSGAILQALKVMEMALSRGKTEATALCQQIAARVAADSDFDDVVAIRLVTGTHDAVEYLARGRIGIESDIVRCEVKR